MNYFAENFAYSSLEQAESQFATVQVVAEPITVPDLC